MMMGLGAVTTVLGAAKADADPLPVAPGPVTGPGAAPAAPAGSSAGPAMLFREQFNGPAGAPPDPAWWFIVPEREGISPDTFGARIGEGLAWELSKLQGV